MAKKVEQTQEPEPEPEPQVVHYYCTRCGCAVFIDYAYGRDNGDLCFTCKFTRMRGKKGDGELMPGVYSSSSNEDEQEEQAQ